MNPYNNNFFEEFKRLDKLCCGIYQTDRGGVTSYIEDMKAAAWFDSRAVPNWERDLAKLKQLRHYRNQLAHEEGAFEEVLCIQDDIDWLKDFHDRILDRSDPMALLHQNALARQQAAQRPHPGPQTSVSTHYTSPPAPRQPDRRPRRSPWMKPLTAVLILAALVLGGIAVIAVRQMLPV